MAVGVSLLDEANGWVVFVGEKMIWGTYVEASASAVGRAVLKGIAARSARRVGMLDRCMVVGLIGGM